jgi:amino acid adenylation domain-containing protein
MTITSEQGHVFPASYGQQRMWFLCQLDPSAGRSLHLRSAHEVTGDLDAGLLRRALAFLVERHESLRTRFVLLDEVEAPVGDRLVQIVADTGQVPIAELDLSGADDDRVGAALTEEADREFDLEWGPLLRGCLIRRGPRRHVLLLTMHHIVGDAWSLGVLGRELSTVYAALLAGRRPELDELAVQYADFAEWQRDLLSGPSYDTHRGYWRSKLRDLPVLDLPTDRPRPFRQSYRGARVPLRLPAPVVSAVAGLAQRTGTTPFMVHLAAWQVLLGRLTGQREFGVSTPVAGRTRPEIEPLIGFFVNSLVLRASLDGEPSFRTVLERVRETALDAYAHQDVPFEKVVEELSPERDLSRPPLAQVAFAYQNLPRAGLALPGADVTPVELPARATGTELGLTLHPDGDEVRGWIEFNRDLFDDETVRRLAGQWRGLLEQAVDAPDRAVAVLPLLDEADLDLVRRLSGRDEPPPPGGPLPDAIAQWQERTPQAEAVRATAGSLTYGELRGRVNRLAHWLTGAGVRPGDVVGVALPRSADLAAVLLAVWQAGAAYLPLDPSFPPARREYMVADSGARLVVTPQTLAGAAGTIAAQPGTPTGIRPHDRGPAYVIYTSGSTGRPKGVVVPHRAIAALVAAMAGVVGLRPGDVWAAVTTISFDIAGLEFFAPLSTGGVLALLDRDAVVETDLLRDRLAVLAPDVMQATPSLWRALLATGWRPPPNLRIICGGEALPAALAADLTAGGTPVWNAYGPTETTVWSTVARIRPGEPVTLGRAVPGQWAEVVDERGAPVPFGAMGELIIGGVGVATGYHARPGLTAQRFRPSPTGHGQRVYRTGDLARLTRDGRLLYLGRADGQVKLRGHRVELGEIEAVLSAQPGVAEAAAALRGSGEHGYLVGYVVPADPAAAPARDRLIEAVRDRLPEHMVPTVWAELPGLPLTPNGKLDRGALPDVRPAGDGPSQPPRTELERHVLRVWQRLLERTDVGVTDNFFAAGGHSLLAARLVADLERTLNVRLSVGQIFTLGTVRQIAGALDAAPTVAGPPAADSFDGEVADLWQEESPGQH